MAESDKPDVEDLKAQFRQLADDVAKLSEILQGLAHGAAEDARESARAYAGEARDMAGRMSDTAGAELEALERMIARKPLQSAALALVAGLVVGRLWRG